MFKKAERKKARLRLALCGPSGSGKTYSSLLIAQGLGGRIALIDTERGSGELYAHLCDYDTCQIGPPFNVNKYIEAIHAAEAAGYDTIIIDSLSHAWAAEGGLLDTVDKKTASSSSRNSFNAWRDVTPLHNALVDAMLQSKCHIIATMRTKTAYEVQENDRGKKAPVKVGTAPVQREGMDYEFTVVFDISPERHMAAVNKDRTGLFDGQIFQIKPDIGARLKTWLEDGVDPPEPSSPADPGYSDKQRAAFFAMINDKLPWMKNDREELLRVFSLVVNREIKSSKELTSAEVDQIIKNPSQLLELGPSEDEYKAMKARAPITEKTLKAIESELQRLGAPIDQLPPGFDAAYGAINPAILAEGMGQTALAELKKMSVQ